MKKNLTGKTISFILIILSLSSGSKVFTQNHKDSINLNQTLFSDFNNQLPLHKKRTFSIKNISILGLSIGGALVLDEWINDQLGVNKNRMVKHYTDAATVFGEKMIMAPATLGIWAFGKISKDNRLASTSYNAGKALITGAIVAESIKIISGRSRPDMNRGPWHFDAFGGTTNDTKSFPSGHAFVSWALFTPFAQEYSKWFYIIPASVSLARMYRQRHWFSDVVLGSGIGYFAGLYFHRRKNQKVIFTGHGIIVRF